MGARRACRNMAWCYRFAHCFILRACVHSCVLRSATRDLIVKTGAAEWELKRQLPSLAEVMRPAGCSPMPFNPFLPPVLTSPVPQSPLMTQFFQPANHPAYVPVRQPLFVPPVQRVPAHPMSVSTSQSNDLHACCLEFFLMVCVPR